MIGNKVYWLSNLLCLFENVSCLVGMNSYHVPLRLLNSCTLIGLQLNWVMGWLQQQINPSIVHLINCLPLNPFALNSSRRSFLFIRYLIRCLLFLFFSPLSVAAIYLALLYAIRWVGEYWDISTRILWNSVWVIGWLQSWFIITLQLFRAPIETLRVLRRSWNLFQFLTYSIVRVYSLILIGLDRFLFAFSLHVHLFRSVNFATAIFHRTFSLLFSDRVSKWWNRGLRFLRNLAAKSQHKIGIY